MKKLMLLLAIAGMMMAGCKKEDECEISCQNGGWKPGSGMCECACPSGFSGVYCEYDNRPACEKNNTGDYQIYNFTDDDWNIFIDGGYVGWMGAWGNFSKENIPVGVHTTRYEQTNYIFYPDIIYGSIEMKQCIISAYTLN